jgi:hypothetical protein
MKKRHVPSWKQNLKRYQQSDKVAILRVEEEPFWRRDGEMYLASRVADLTSRPKINIIYPSTPTALQSKRIDK